MIQNLQARQRRRVEQALQNSLNEGHDYIAKKSDESGNDKNEKQS